MAKKKDASQPVAEQTGAPKQGTGGGVGQAQVNQSSGSGESSGSSYSYTSYSSQTAPDVPEPPASQLPNQLPVETQHEEIPNAPDLTPQLDQWLAAAQAQANNQIDYATQQGITELQRAQEDAQPQFQQMRDQVSADEARALDNQALYAEARGDRGGIGQAQYNSIQNTAAQNRLQVQQQQTKLATDTSRAIADLRAKGEFEKADKMLQLTQTYLSQLIQLEQWAAEYNMNAAQFRESINQWEAEYRTKVAQILEDQRQWDASYALQRANFLQSQYEFAEQMGWEQKKWGDQQDQWAQEFNFDKDKWQQEFNFDKGQFSWQQNKYEQGTLADAGQALLSAGILPSDSQLKAMGMTKTQAQNYIAALQLAMAAGSGSGGSGGSGKGSSGGSGRGSGSSGSGNSGGSRSGGSGSGGSGGFGNAYSDYGRSGGSNDVYFRNGMNMGFSANTGSGSGRNTGSSSKTPVSGLLEKLKQAKSFPITYNGKTYNSPDEIAAALSSLNLTEAQMKALNAWAQAVWGGTFEGMPGGGGGHGGHGNHGNNKVNMAN